MRYLLIICTLLFINNVFSQEEQNLRWVNTIGNIFLNSTASVTVDNGGNAYTGGYFGGTVDFDPGPGVLEFTAGNQTEPFIAKYTAIGSIVWATHMIGRGEVTDLSIDSQNSIIVTGHFNQNLILDINTTLTATTPSAQFLAKYSSSGNLLWAFSLDTNSTFGVNLTTAVDHNDDIILGGSVSLSVDLDPSAAVAEVTAGPLQRDSFLAKYTSNGSYLWGQIIRQNSASGAAVADSLNAILLDSTNNIYAAGVYNGSTSFGMGANSQTLVSNSTDAFLLKLNASGDLQWLRTTTGTGLRKEHVAIGMDLLGNIYMTGVVIGEIDFDPDPINEAITTVNALNGYLLSYNINGNFRWYGLIDSPTLSLPQDLVVAPNGTLTIVGGFSSTTDFDPSNNLFELTALSTTDSFFAQYDNTGTLLGAYQLVGTFSNNFGSKIHSVARVGEEFWMVGEFRLTVDFDPSEDILLITSTNSSQDGFVARYGNTVFANGFE